MCRGRGCLWGAAPNVDRPRNLAPGPPRPYYPPMCSSCNVEELLAEAGLRVTPGRTALLKALSRAAKPLTAGEAIRLARGQGARMDKVTAYRNLHCFWQSGLAHAVAGPDGLERYCLAGPDKHPAHAHFACRTCGKLACLPAESAKVSSPESVPCAGVVGRIEQAQVLYTGLCAGCLDKEPEK